MMRKVVSPGGKKSSAPLSPGIQVGDFLFCSGQVGVDRETGTVPEDIKEQTRNCFKNLEKVVRAAGATMNDVVKVNVYLTNMDDFSDMNEAYAEVFPEDPPARTTVGIKGLVREEFKIEIELVALIDA